MYVGRGGTAFGAVERLIATETKMLTVARLVLLLACFKKNMTLPGEIHGGHVYIRSSFLSRHGLGFVPSKATRRLGS